VEWNNRTSDYCYYLIIQIEKHSGSEEANYIKLQSLCALPDERSEHNNLHRCHLVKFGMNSMFVN